MRHQGYTSNPPLPEVRAANRQFAEVQKERKDAEKRRRKQKRKDKEKREKANREQVREGKLPFPSPDTMPEPESSPSASGNVDHGFVSSFLIGRSRTKAPDRQGCPCARLEWCLLAQVWCLG